MFLSETTFGLNKERWQFLWD